jgi:uncharacterized protein Yka (UPF0111/DUF47 family)
MEKQIEVLKENVKLTTDQDKKMEYLEELSEKLNNIDGFTQKIADKEKQGDDLMALHNQQRADEKA